MTPPRRILLLRGGALGDFLLTLPAIRLVRARFGGAHLALIAGRAHAQFAAHLGLIDEWRDLESAGLAPFFDPAAEAAPEWSAWLGSFDLVINWLNDACGILRSRITGAGAGCFVQGNGRPDDASDVHASRQLAAVLETGPLFLPVSPADLAQPFGAAERTVLPGRLAIHPGSGSPRKNWPAERWAALLARPELRERFSSLLLISGEAEGSAVEQIGTAARNAGYEVEQARSLPLTELAAELRCCGCFAGHDSGVSHLAGLLALPGVALFGPSRPEVWSPPGRKIQVVRASGPVPATMEQITVDLVLSRLLHL